MSYYIYRVSDLYMTISNYIFDNKIMVLLLFFYIYLRISTTIQSHLH